MQNVNFRLSFFCNISVVFKTQEFVLMDVMFDQTNKINSIFE